MIIMFLLKFLKPIIQLYNLEIPGNIVTLSVGYHIIQWNLQIDISSTLFCSPTIPTLKNIERSGSEDPNLEYYFILVLKCFTIYF